MCCGICLFAAVFIAVKAATHEEPPKSDEGAQPASEGRESPE